MRIGRGFIALTLAFAAFAAPMAVANETTTYTYDALGRLVATSTTGTVNNGQSVTTSFDPAGNRTNYSVSGASGAPPTPTVSVGNAAVTEGGTLAFSVTLSATSTSAVGVSYATSNGSALAGSDYNAAASTATIPAGQTIAAINISTIDDAAQESPETMSLTISSPTGGATLGNATGTGTINDNDATWSSSLTAGSYQVCDPTCNTYHGYLHGTTGSLSNNTFNGYTIHYLWDYNSNVVNFVLAGTAVPPNSGWTSIYVPGIGTLNRSAANYIPDVYGSGTASAWMWYVPGTVVSGTVAVQ